MLFLRVLISATPFAGVYMSMECDWCVHEHGM